MRRLPPPRRVGAALLVSLARLLVHLPGPVLAAALDLVRRLLRALGLPPDGQRALVDLAQTLREDPRGREALREILHRSRPGELSGILEGLWRYHRGAGPARGAAPARGRRAGGAARRVVVVGEGPRADAVAAAYAGVAGCTVVRVPPDAPARLVARCDGAAVVEVVVDSAGAAGASAAGGMGDAGGALDAAAWEALLSRGRLVRLHPPALPSAEGWARLGGRARRVGGRVVLGSPLLAYPPARVARQRIDDGEIGAACSIRVQAIVGGGLPGGGAPGAYALQPGFDHAALLAWLGGPIAEVRGFARPLDPERGGQAVFAVRFAAPGRCGGLELVYAPRWPAAPPGFPSRLEVEVAGTHGILWLRAGAGYAGPPVEVRAGRNHTLVGVGSGLRTSWDAAWHLAACDGLARGARPGPLDLDADPAALRSALRARAQIDATIRSPELGDF